MIAQEKADIISEILNSDQERARRLLMLEPSIAVEEINALGYSFTLDEIKEYGALLKNAQRNQLQGEEINLDVLYEIAGGGENVLIRIPGIISLKISW